MNDAAGPAWLRALGQAAWLVQTPDLRLVAINDEALRLLGLQAQSAPGLDARTLLPTPEDFAAWDDVRAGHAVQLDSSIRMAGPQGQTLHLHRRIAQVPDGSGRWLVTARDESEHERITQCLELERDELRATLESTTDGLLVTDMAGGIRAANHRLWRLWDLPGTLQVPGDDDAMHAAMQARLRDVAAWRALQARLLANATQTVCERLVLLDGRALELTSGPQSLHGRVTGRVWSFRDVTAQAHADQRIQALSTTDGLTGLPHRARFTAMLDDAVRAAQRERASLAVLLVDLDRFRHINDSLGTPLGDRVLVEVTQRLIGCLRQGDHVARFGGDQFALLVAQADLRGAEATARRVLEAAARDHRLDGTSFTVTCSVGIALYPDDGRSGAELLRNAESAVLRAKQAGRGCHRFHQARHDADLRERMRLDHAMRHALAGEHFHLRYQPQLALTDGRVVGAEALIRWHDPVLGDVAPGRFIPVAEDSGFIVALGDWVLRTAVRQAADWSAQGLAMPVAVNVSALQFQQADFVERVAGALAEAHLPGALLELELTESILLHEAQGALQRLHELARLGVTMSIDDFGTGYSSLAYLKRLPIARLKVDRSFIRGLPEDGRDAGIVRAIVQMSKALELQVVAEGVETEGQRTFLQQAGCQMFQGFLVAPALPPVEFAALARQAPTSPGRAPQLSVRPLRVVGG